MNLDQGCPVHCESGPENQHEKKKKKIFQENMKNIGNRFIGKH